MGDNFRKVWSIPQQRKWKSADAVFQLSKSEMRNQSPEDILCEALHFFYQPPPPISWVPPLVGMRWSNDSIQSDSSSGSADVYELFFPSNLPRRLQEAEARSLPIHSLLDLLSDDDDSIHDKDMPRMCCVPLCSSNYRSQGGPTVTTFAFPKNVDRRELWLKCIPRENFVPGNSAAVCIKHFKEEYIVREVSATRDDGTILVVRRDRPKLSEDAYPSIFEDTSKTCNRRKKLPIRRGRGTTTKNEEDVIDEPPPSTPPKTEPTLIDIEISTPSPSEKQLKREKSDTEQTPKLLEPDVTIQEETTQGESSYTISV
ncbi:Uncharacterized protein GBIM_14634 [Gryllus bimaculatus]|nr:Uncharacterized protein GBIM_14634 [Gryllus bimaculatus]